MNIRKHLYSLTILSFPLWLSARSVISGLVLANETGKPIENAQVFLFDTDSILTVSTFTDVAGKFVLQYEEKDCKPLYVRAVCMGYRGEQQDVLNVLTPVILKMTTSNFELKEVKFVAERIEVKADTLVYDVAAFADATDRSIGDVIARMPGLDIQQDGQILYQGKPINRFYIEGMDLLDGKYRQATENIDRKKVAKVEVLRNHQPIAMLRDKEFSENAALNLILNDDSRNVWTKVVAAGGGMNSEEWLYRTKLTAMFFGHKQQHLMLYKDDNTGRNIANELKSHLVADEGLTMMSDGNVVSPICAPTPNIGQNRYLFNKSHLVAANALHKVSDDATLRTQASYLYDNKQTESEHEMYYLLADEQQYLMRERIQLRRVQHQAEINNTYEENSTSHYIRNRVEGRMHWDTSDNDLFLNGQNYQPHVHMRRRYISEILDYRKALDNQKNLMASAGISYDDKPESLRTIGQVSQFLDCSSMRLRALVSWQHRWKRVLVKYVANVNAVHQQIKLKDVPALLAVADEPSQRQNSLGYAAPLAKIEMSYLGAKVNWNGYVGAKVWKGVRPELNASFTYKMTDLNKIAFGYRMENILPELWNTVQGNYYTSYRTKCVSDFKRSMNSRQFLYVHEDYFDTVEGRFLSFTFGGILAHRNNIVKTEMDSIFYQWYIQGADYYEKSLFGNLRLGKTWSVWKSALNVTGNYNLTRSYMVKDGNRKANELSCFRAGVNYSCRPCRWLASDCHATWTNLANDETSHTVSNDVDCSLNMTLMMNRFWKFSVNNTLYRQCEQQSMTHFSDVSLRYENKGWELDCEINNLLNNDELIQSDVTAFFHSVSRFRLRPREWIFSVKKAF